MAVGAPRPDWAEIEPQVWKESKVFVDSFAGAKTESGDLIQSNCDVEDELGGFINKGRYLRPESFEEFHESCFTTVVLNFQK